MNALHSIAFAAFLAGAVSAQANNSLGFAAGFDISYIDRLGATTTVADLLNHFDERDYRDWMLDPADATGATYRCNGVRFIMQDQVANTPETYTVAGYNEDPALADFPNTAALWFRTGTISYPPMPATFPTPTGPIAWIITVTFTSPPTPKGDKWLGLGLPQPATGTWPSDGLSMQCAFDLPANNTGTNALDRVGPGIASMNAGNLSCAVITAGGVPTGPATYPSGTIGNRRQMFLEVIANATGGVCVTQTNQTRYPSSNPGSGNTAVPLGGTTNMLSGINPDTIDANLSTPARADDIGFLVTDTNFPNAPVFVMVATGPNPVGSLPITSLAPGLITPNSRGNVCIDFTTAPVFLNFTNAAGICQHMLILNAGTRSIINLFRPLDLWYQAFVVNTSATVGVELHSTGCGIQHL